MPTTRARWAVALGALLAAGLLGAGCDSRAHVAAPAHGALGATTSSTGPAPSIEVTPSGGSTAVALDVPVRISAVDGHLTAVSLVPAKGSHSTPIGGHLLDGGRTWTSEGVLQPATAYRLQATATGLDGRTATTSTTFTTLTPAHRLSARVAPLDGATVGVGQPLAVYLSSPVTDHAALERRLTVTTVPPVAGAWHWFSDTELHYRPEAYWPAHTTVTLDADLAGHDLGGGTVGDASRHVSFTVGDAHVSVVDATTHQMVVSTDGVVVRTIPVSTGRDKYPTKSGVHVVTEKAETTVMDSSTVGIPVDSPDGYKETVHWNVRISNSGEFVHAAPWSVGSQGRANVSHGCVNVSTADAQWFFGYAQPGDVVEVRGTPDQLEPTNGFGDWNIPWSSWSG